ncbi:MAG: ABC transporter [Ruminococcaceae bacterium]|nr:ABC transporter [Oscillospiraceae bacterium]
MKAIYKRELKSYFNGMTGPIFIAFVLLMIGIYMVVYNFNGLYPNFEYVLSAVSFIYMLGVPVLTMRSVAEEKHSKTDQLLYSLPMSVTDIVMAKYFAMITVLFIPCAVASFYPLILCSFGKVHLLPAYATLLAFFLLGAALIAIGMFISSLTESQVIAAVISIGVLVLINFMSGLSTLVSDSASVSLTGVIIAAIVIALVIHTMIKNTVVTVSAAAVISAGAIIVYIIDSSLFEGLVPNILSAFALFDRLTIFTNGMFDLTAVVLYVSVIALFVYFTVQSMEKKRWN